MIKAYLAAFPMLYEGEDIEVRYSLFQDDIPIKKESIYLGYETGDCWIEFYSYYFAEAGRI